jgi:hypothetical protein
LALEFPDHVLEASVHVLQGDFAHPIHSLGSPSNTRPACPLARVAHDLSG